MEFRKNIGAIIINLDGKVLGFERSDFSDSWQFPQGGLNRGENFLEGIYREVREETGLKKENLVLIKEIENTLTYEYPEEIKLKKGFRGQQQKWFIFRIKNGVEIDLGKATDSEFVDWKWMNFDEIIEKTAEFRKEVYRELKNNIEEMCR